MRGRQAWATGRRNWLFAGTLAAGQRAAAITNPLCVAKQFMGDLVQHLLRVASCPLAKP